MDRGSGSITDVQVGIPSVSMKPVAYNELERELRGYFKAKDENEAGGQKARPGRLRAGGDQRLAHIALGGGHEGDRSVHQVHHGQRRQTPCREPFVGRARSRLRRCIRRQKAAPADHKNVPKKSMKAARFPRLSAQFFRMFQVHGAWA